MRQSESELVGHAERWTYAIRASRIHRFVASVQNGESLSKDKSKRAKGYELNG